MSGEYSDGWLRYRNIVITHPEVCHFGKNVSIGNDVYIDVTEDFTIEDNSRIGKGWEICGRRVHIGRNLFCDDGPRHGNGVIGGGQCYDALSSIEIGDNCFLGCWSYINTARPVKIGDNVGFGIHSMIFTHGAWQNVLEGYPAKFAPVTIEDNVWCPTNVLILPGVTIGKGATVAAGSVVIKDVNPYTFVGGNPAKLIRGGVGMGLNPLQKKERVEELLMSWVPFVEFAFKDKVLFENKNMMVCGRTIVYDPEGDVITIYDSAIRYPENALANFQLRNYILEIIREGASADAVVSNLRNHLRRNGVKFVTR